MDRQDLGAPRLAAAISPAPADRCRPRRGVALRYASSARPHFRRLFSPQGRLRSLVQGEDKRAETSDKHDDVCGVCECFGELICCDGGCKRAFHAECIPPNNPVPDQTDGTTQRWVCSDCRSKRFRCFFCKEWGQARPRNATRAPRRQPSRRRPLPIVLPM